MAGSSDSYTTRSWAPSSPELSSLPRHPPRPFPPSQRSQTAPSSSTSSHAPGPPTSLPLCEPPPLTTPGNSGSRSSKPSTGACHNGMPSQPLFDTEGKAPQAVREALKLLRLLISAAVQGEDKEEAIAAIRGLGTCQQTRLMQDIEQGMRFPPRVETEEGDASVMTEYAPPFSHSFNRGSADWCLFSENTSLLSARTALQAQVKSLQAVAGVLHAERYDMLVLARELRVQAEERRGEKQDAGKEEIQSLEDQNPLLKRMIKEDSAAYNREKHLLQCLFHVLWLAVETDAALVCCIKNKPTVILRQSWLAQQRENMMGNLSQMVTKTKSK
ncbi:hypothetical protein CALVIDRAFT_569302 [Calocera viscosa TUFC12733]|uniref:Uncharacterized protein n=1 Tax=Calocera viscosa (strain TUFC12733) TaxID=1330018 RepID=A0A167G5Q1_CALVF|nr:hypothetical protein CALVIDRAFT_569302 [Calocera viscosa TUFC12733]